MFRKLKARISAYFRKKYDPQKFTRFFENLATDRSLFSTNSILKTSSFLLIVSVVIMFTIYQQKIYILSNMDFLEYLAKAEPNAYRLILLTDSSLYPQTSEDVVMSVVPLTQTAIIIFAKKFVVQKLSFEAFGAMIQMISLLRFIVLSRKFNVPTGFVMAVISFCASYVYYIELRYWVIIHEAFIPNMHTSSYLRRLYYEIQATKSDRTLIKTVSTPLAFAIRMYNKLMVSQQTSNFIYGQGEFVTYPKVKYYTDPFSLVMNRVINFWHDDYLNKNLTIDLTQTSLNKFGILDFLMRVGIVKTDHIDFFEERKIECYKYILGTWYLLGQVGSKFIAWSNKALSNMLPLLVFTTLVRRLKEWMPYLIRWHWATLYYTSFIRNAFAGWYKNLGAYIQTKEIANDYVTMVEEWEDYVQSALSTGGELNTNHVFSSYNQNLRVGSLEFIQTVDNKLAHIISLELGQTFMFAIYAFWLILGGLHAVSGQYYFIPLLTPNIELHIGNRKDDSIYCGGQMAWQDTDEKTVYRKFWYGFFGRGTDKPPVILFVYDFIKDLFIKFFKIFRR